MSPAPSRRRPARACLAVVVTLSFVLTAQVATADAAPRSFGDGAWSWFADPRGIHHDGVHRRTYVGWVDQGGDVKVSAYDHDSLARTTAVLRTRLEVDDHANPALMVRPDGRLMVFYSAHAGGQLHYRVSRNPEDVSSWGPPSTLPVNTPGTRGYTYPNPVRLAAEGRTYLFWRGGNFNPTYATQADGSSTWSDARNVILVPGERPYVKVHSDGSDTIHFAFTNAHPAEHANVNIYYASYRAGALRRADGTAIGPLGTPIAPSQADTVFNPAEKTWIHDVAADGSGRPVLVFARFVSVNDHRYMYARWNGSAWQTREITRAGASISANGRQPYYSGGITLDHEDPATVYLSRDVAGVHEVETWRTPDHGVTWSRQAVTAGSSTQNLRPISPRGLIPFSGDASVVWMRGAYDSYLTYRTSIATLFETGGNHPPIADAAPTPASGRAPLEVSFDGTAATDPGGAVVDWSWDFDDGTQASGPKVTHTYTTGGRYFPKLTVTDREGAEDTYVSEVVVDDSSASGYAQDVLGTPGLLSYWRLGESSGTVARDERGVNPGTYRGDFTLGEPGALAGDADTSAGFGGSRGELTAGGPALSQAGTLEGWFDWRGGVALMRDNTSAGGWILAYDSGGSLNYRVGGTTFATGLSTASVRNGWHHVVVTKDGGAVSFYLDGVLVHSGTGAGSTAARSPWHVMRNGSTTQYSRGQADEVAVYDRALSAATVQRHYEAGKGEVEPPPPPASGYAESVLATGGLLSYWRLGESSGTAARDERGVNPGTYRGGYSLGGLGALTDDPDTSAGFDGSRGELTAPGPALSAAGTLEGWFDWRGGVALMRDNTSAGGWILAYDSGGSLNYRVGGTTFATGLSTASVRNGWHHFAVTKNGGGVSFYLDGVPVHSGTGAGSAAASMPWHVMRNGTFTNQYSRGQADELAVYDRALTAATVAQHYEAGRSP